PVVTAKFDLSLTVTELEGELLCQLEYATDLFDRTTVARLRGGFERILQEFVERTETPLSEVSLLCAAERHQLLWEWSGERVVVGPTVPLHGLIAEQVWRRPHAVAVAAAEMTLSYGELEAQAERLARRLGSLGVGPETRVGVCVQRSARLVVA